MNGPCPSRAQFVPRRSRAEGAFQPNTVSPGRPTQHVVASKPNGKTDGSPQKLAVAESDTVARIGGFTETQMAKSSCRRRELFVRVVDEIAWAMQVRQSTRA